MTNTEYVPGVCNIGGAEIKARKRAAYLGGAVFLALSAIFIFTNASTIIRLFAFIPAMGAAIGFYQARAKFCVAFGLMGVFNFGNKGKTTKVDLAESLRADRIYAYKLIAKSFVVSILLTVLVVIL